MKKKVRQVLFWIAALALIGTPVLLVTTDTLPYRAYVVQTGSMAPTIPPQSLVIVEAGAYLVGQVVTFHRQGTLTTHRLMAVNDDGTLTTKGDANETVDPFTVHPADVIGGVVASPPKLGFWIVYVQNPLTLGSLVVCGLSLWLVFSMDDDDDDDETVAVQAVGRLMAA